MLRDLLLQGDRLACCPVTVAEVYSGMLPHEEARTGQLISSLVLFDISRAVSRRAGRLRFDWARKGVTLSLADTLIAATALLEYTLTLVTDNRRHFPMPELSVHVWDE